MRPDDRDENSLDTPPQARGATFAGYVVILVGCLFAIFYTYKASREDAPAPMDKANQPRERAIEQQLPEALSRGRLLPKLPRRSHSQRPLRPQHNGCLSDAPTTPGTEPQPLQGAAAAPPAAAAQAPAAAAPSPNAPAPSQGTQPGTATQTAPSNDDLELAFNGHCRECHSFEKNDNRLGPTCTGWWVARLATVS